MKSIKSAKSLPALCLVNYIKSEYDNDVSAFADQHGFSTSKINDVLGAGALWINERVFIIVTQKTSNFKLPKKAKSTLLFDYIDHNFNGDTQEFATDFGESLPFIESVSIAGGVYVHGEIATPIPVLQSWEAIPLKEYIRREYKNNRTGFARAYQSTQQQVHRWIHKHCIWCRGEVYMRRTYLTEFEELPDSMEAIKLKDHIDSHYNGDSSSFADACGLRPTQVDRYLDYEAIWVMDEIYKNQSKFKEKGIDPAPELAKKNPRVMKNDPDTN